MQLFIEKPLEIMIAGFSLGISFEMHPQNFLMKFSKDGNPEKVIARDMEGILFFENPKHKTKMIDLIGDEYRICESDSHKMRKRYFNRNIDLDLTRFIDNMLELFIEEGVFSAGDVISITKKIRCKFQAIKKRYNLNREVLTPSYLHYSVSPYGKFYNRHHYFRIKYR